MGVEPIDLRKLDEHAANVYEAIIVCGKKARQINDEQHLEYNSMISTIPVASGDEEGEDLSNPQQLKISLEFEKRDKPHIQSLKRLMEDDVEYEYKEKPQPFGEF